VAQAGQFLGRKSDIAMPCHVDVRIGEKFLVHDLHAGLLSAGVNAGVLPDKAQQIGQRGGVAVPIAAALVLQPGNSEKQLLLLGMAGGTQ